MMPQGDITHEQRGFPALDLAGRAGGGREREGWHGRRERGRRSSHRVAQGLEEHPVREKPHAHLLIRKRVYADGSAARGCFHLMAARRSTSRGSGISSGFI